MVGVNFSSLKSITVERILNDLTQANNVIEGFHNALQS